MNELTAHEIGQFSTKDRLEHATAPFLGRVSGVLATLLVSACAAEPPGVSGSPVGSSPPAEILRCTREAPLPTPAEWPHLPSYETALDASGGEHMRATWQRAQDLATAGHCSEACEGFRTLWRDAISAGYRPKLIPLSSIGPACCAAGFSEFLLYHTPETCSPPTEYPWAEGKDPASGIFWINHYLTGLAYFRSGKYEDAKTCFQSVPATHGWGRAAMDCVALIDELQGEQRPPM